MTQLFTPNLAPLFKNYLLEAVADQHFSERDALKANRLQALRAKLNSGAALTGDELTLAIEAATAMAERLSPTGGKRTVLERICEQLTATLNSSAGLPALAAAAAAKRNATLEEVLQLDLNRGPAYTPVALPSLHIVPGSLADEVVEKAALRVRRLSMRSVSAKSNDPHDVGWACAETCCYTALDAVETLAKDDRITAAVVEQIFMRATHNLRGNPTLLATQVQMQLCAIQAAKTVRQLLHKQEALAF